ncbi:hypothetical protein EX30DRAFT_344319 [Ascodesmis nigricans]|uniref:SMP domain-containing protein n=1 Tax=Ascodesmis nigricans TaxID=341454 RepID=A0A4S2MK09_9PEZI|nr:hypothetical protein EX30DRAFT_344319 [Ascodesmis nigricans]
MPNKGNKGKDTSKADASRIQSTQEKGGKDTGTGSFASRAQSAADKKTTESATGGNNNNGKGKKGKK